MYSKIFLAWGAVAVTAICSPIDRYEPHETRDTSTAWLKQSRAPPDVTVAVHLSLTQSNLDRGREALLDLSDPASPRYGQHWSAEEVREMFAPASAVVDRAHGWLQSSGISNDRIRSSYDRARISFDATVQELENLLDAEYHIFEHPRHGLALGCDEYHVPVDMYEHIDFISPGVGLASGQKPQRPANHQKRDSSCPSNGPVTIGFQPESDIPTSFDLANCSAGVYPECIRALYGIPDGPPCDSNSSIGIFALNNTYVQDDLDIYFKHFASNVPVGSSPNTSIINEGKMLDSFLNTGTFEADLDVQMAWPLTYPQKLNFYNVNPSVEQIAGPLSTLNITNYTDQSVLVLTVVDDLLSALDKAYCNDPSIECGDIDIPTVLSFSYAPEELAVPQASANRLCDEFMKLGLQGTTVVAASGDWGVAQLAGEPDVCFGPDNAIFNPSALASCPWVTVVGSTQINANQSIDSAESVSSVAAPGVPFHSGGGFSNYHTLPQYQNESVSQWFQHSAAPYKTYAYDGSAESIGADGGLYNRNGRGFPDVATIGSNIFAVAGGCFGPEGGTSFSTPIFAGMISRINAERLAAGKKSLGFINPALYANTCMFNDITSGHSAGCGTDGFAAVTGWDPVTGLGTPKFPEMLSYFKSLP